MANENDAKTIGLEPHNRRFPEQWKIVTEHVDFWEKEVLDLGCGYGDMVAACYLAGASILGVDYDDQVVVAARERLSSMSIPRACIWPGDITDLNDEQWDIVICFSVLPYLPAPGTTISWMKRHGKISLIEMQYKGDGPGKMLDDEQMRCWLLLVFDKVTPIGKTLVDYRNKWRTIWMCT